MILVSCGVPRRGITRLYHQEVRNNTREGIWSATKLLLGIATEELAVHQSTSVDFKIANATETWQVMNLAEMQTIYSDFSWSHVLCQMCTDVSMHIWVTVRRHARYYTAKARIKDHNIRPFLVYVSVAYYQTQTELGLLESYSQNWYHVTMEVTIHLT